MPSITGNGLKNMVCPWAMLTDWGTNRALKVSIPISFFSNSTNLLKNIWKGHASSNNFTCTLSLCFWKLRVQPWVLFGSVRPLSSNATTDVLMLMLSLILSHSFLIPLSQWLKENPLEQSKGLCANMIRANRLPNNKQRKSKTERDSQKEIHGKTKVKKRSWMKRRLKRLRERILHQIKGQAAAEVMDEWVWLCGWVERGLDVGWHGSE